MFEGKVRFGAIQREQIAFGRSKNVPCLLGNEKEEKHQKFIWP